MGINAKDKTTEPHERAPTFTCYQVERGADLKPPSRMGDSRVTRRNSLKLKRFGEEGRNGAGSDT